MVINSEYECGGFSLFNARKVPAMALLLLHPLHPNSAPGGWLGSKLDEKQGSQLQGQEDKGECAALRLGLLPLYDSQQMLSVKHKQLILDLKIISLLLY